jgi:hypothetical protein
VLRAVAQHGINDEGPHAFLMRSIARHAPGCNKNYTKASESVEDIAGSMLGHNFMQLVVRFNAQIVPCIVKFQAAGDFWQVSHALYYVYLVEHGMGELDAADLANTCLPDRGQPIPPGDIISIDLL